VAGRRPIGSQLHLRAPRYPGPPRSRSARATTRLPVVESIVPAEHERCERLLGQLASLEARATNAVLAFLPAPGTGSLARRALAHLDR
jgi:hypothetical protein